MTTRYTNLPDNKDKPFGGAYSVYDPTTIQSRDIIARSYAGATHDFEALKLEYFDRFKDFLSSPHNLHGLDKYTKACFTQGTTESFGHFYIRYRNKRLRIAKGEYFYHQMIKSLYFSSNFAWLEDDELKAGDCLLISAPFSDTCDLYPNLDSILSRCSSLDIPVMLDLAYINLAVDLEIDLNHSCIEYVVSSLSKVFPLENYRVGIRLQRTMYEDPLYVINEANYNYINMCSLHLGLNMMKTYDPRYIYDKYRDKQLEFCERLDLQPSRCVYFGIDHNSKYPIYNRGRDTNRLCFSRVWDGRMTYDE